MGFENFDPRSVLDPEGRGLRTFNPAIRLNRLFELDATRDVMAFELIGDAIKVRIDGVTTEDDSMEADAGQSKNLEDRVRDGKHLLNLLPPGGTFYDHYTGVLVELLPSDKEEAIAKRRADAATKVMYHMPVDLMSQATGDLLELMQKAQWKKTAV